LFSRIPEFFFEAWHSPDKTSFEERVHPPNRALIISFNGYSLEEIAEIFTIVFGEITVPFDGRAKIRITFHFPIK
jgi:hypothetical protein